MADKDKEDILRLRRFCLSNTIRETATYNADGSASSASEKKTASVCLFSCYAFAIAKKCHSTCPSTPSSSIGDGGSSAFLRNCAVTQAIPHTTFPFNGKLNGSIKWFPHSALIFLRLYFGLVVWSRILRLNLLTFLGKLYVLPIESAFKYSHQLNRNESSNGFYILRSHFKFTYSVAFSENHASVTFSENRKSMMSYRRDFPE